MATIDEEASAYLEHYGVPGMKWGRRKGSTGTSAKEARKSKPAKEDISKLSDNELRTRINRMNMEKQYSQLTAGEKNKGKSLVTGMLADVGKDLAKDYLKRYAKKGLEVALKAGTSYAKSSLGK